MATLQYYDSFLSAFKAGKHDFRHDALKAVLTRRSPLRGDCRLSQVRELHAGVGWGGHPAGGLAVPGFWEGSESAGIYSTGPVKFTATHQWVEQFRFVVIYNDATADDLLIGYYDFGHLVLLFEGETFTLPPTQMLVLPLAAEFQAQAIRAMSA